MEQLAGMSKSKGEKIQNKNPPTACMVGHAPNVHFLRFKVEQVHESRLGHGRVSGVVVCGLQKSAKSGAGRDIRDPAPAPGLGGGGNLDAGGPLLLNNSNI